MGDTISFWATLLSPIAGVIAIIVALVISNRSSRDAEKQVKAIHNLLDVFVAAQNPNIMAAKKQYEQQLLQLDKQILEVKDELEIVNPFFGRGPKIEDMMYLEEKKQQQQYLDNLIHQRKDVELQRNLIQTYLDKTAK